MASKKKGGSSSGDRPPLRSSHERVLDGSTTKSKTKALRRTARAYTDDRIPPAPGRGKQVAAAPRVGSSAARARPEKKGHATTTRSQEDATRGWSVASDSARQRATTIAIAALDKKAIGIEILDVAGKVDYADFLVIMTGRSDRHAQALAQGIEEALKSKGERAVAVEGLPHGSWVLMDFGDVVVHVFQDETRQLYDIEGLWLDARRLPVPGPTDT